MHYWQSLVKTVDKKSSILTQVSEIILDDTYSKKQSRDLRKYYLGEKYLGVYFTKREAESMFWLAHEFTISEAAQKMQLSARTIEFYLKNMKLKLKCASKKRLVEKIWQTDLLSQLEAEGMRLTRH